MVEGSPFLIHVSTALWVLGALAFIVSSVWLTVVDLSTRKIPNRLVSRLTVVTLGLLAASAVVLLLSRSSLGTAVADLWQLCAGAIGLFGVFYLLWRVSPRSIGGGDVKLAPLVGGLLGMMGGLWAVLLGAVLAFATAAIWGALLRRRVGEASRTVPFAPCLFLGAWLAIVLTPVASRLFS